MADVGHDGKIVLHHQHGAALRDFAHDIGDHHHVFMPHAGGLFPWIIGRLAKAMEFSKELKHVKHPARHYLRRFHYDLITHDPQIMRWLIDLVGVDRICIGTDFPQGMAVMQPLDFVESIPGLTHEERRMILVETPKRLLRL